MAQESPYDSHEAIKLYLTQGTMKYILRFMIWLGTGVALITPVAINLWNGWNASGRPFSLRPKQRKKRRYRECRRAALARGRGMDISVSYSVPIVASMRFSVVSLKASSGISPAVVISTGNSITQHGPGITTNGRSPDSSRRRRPVGMLLAYQLDRLNVPCLLAERSLDTTKWPKMDLTNCRSMELLRVLGLADEYRNLEGSVDPGVDFNSLFVTRAMGRGKLLGAWVGITLL